MRYFTKTGTTWTADDTQTTSASDNKEVKNYRFTETEIFFERPITSQDEITKEDEIKLNKKVLETKCA